MECPPTCSAWCEAVPSIDGIGLLKTSDSISSESCACQGTMEVWYLSFFCECSYKPQKYFHMYIRYYHAFRY